MRAPVGWLSILVLVPAAGCAGGDSEELDTMRSELSSVEDALASTQDELSTVQDELSTAQDDLAGAQGELAEATATVSSLEAERDALSESADEARAVASDLESELAERDEELATAQSDLETSRADLEAALGATADLEAERDAAVEELEEIRVRFDPEIQAAVAAAQQAAADAACAAGDAYGADPSGAAPNAQTFIEEALTGLPDGATIDEAAVQARLDECIVQGEARAAAAVLTEPKGDGLWTVGLEIAPGRWRSSGTGDDCYWQRSPDGNPDDIIDNHFGLAGGTVTIREGEEFETEDCGVWEFVG